MFRVCTVWRNLTASLLLSASHLAVINQALFKVQGINRLGKAPPRPGSLRPPDPNRNRVLDIYSEGTEGDADYMRMVQDVSAAIWHLLGNIEPSCKAFFKHVWHFAAVVICSHGSFLPFSCRLRMHSRVRLGGCLAEEVRMDFLKTNKI